MIFTHLKFFKLRDDLQVTTVTRVFSFLTNLWSSPPNLPSPTCHRVHGSDSGIFARSYISILQISVHLKKKSIIEGDLPCFGLLVIYNSRFSLCLCILFCVHQENVTTENYANPSTCFFHVLFKVTKLLAHGCFFYSILFFGGNFNWFKYSIIVQCYLPVSGIYID